VYAQQPLNAAHLNCTNASCVEQPCMRIFFALLKGQRADGKMKVIYKRLQDSVAKDLVICDGRLISIRSQASPASRESLDSARNMCDWSCSLCVMVLKGSPSATIVEGSCPPCYMKLDCPAVVAFKGRNGLYGQQYSNIGDFLTYLEETSNHPQDVDRKPAWVDGTKEFQRRSHAMIS
jgi:hypothetical protein